MSGKVKGQPSISDVARLAGVSLGTVSNVLNNPDRVKPETVSRVQGAIEKLGFVRNDAARQLKAGRSSALGLVVLDATNPFFAEVARGAEEAALVGNFHLLIGSSGHDKNREAGYLKTFQEQRLSGVMVSPVDEPTDMIGRLRAIGTNLIVVDGKASTQICCSVSVDDVAGGRLAIEHLLSIGRSRIAFVGASRDIQQVADRLAGAREAIAAAQIESSLRIYTAKSMDVISGREVGNQILNEPKHLRPDAIFAANDLLAVGLLQAFAVSGRAMVPEEIALVGYDDISFAQAAVVPLSSIKQPAQLIGSTAVELLLDEINNSSTHQHQQVNFQPELIIRASSISSAHGKTDT